MRVVLVGSSYPAEFVGGTERVMRALARSLTAAGDSVAVLCGTDRPLRDGEVLHDTLDEVEVRRLPRAPDEPYGLDLRRPRLQAVYRRELADLRPDVVHVHSWPMLSTGLVRGAQELGAGTVVTTHDMWATCARFFRLPPAGITCPTDTGRDACVACARLDLGHLSTAALVAGFADRDAEIGAELAAAGAVVAPSRACRDRLRRHLTFTGPIEVVPHGLLDPARPRRQYSAPERILRVGTFGNLVADKGVLLLVRACAGIGGIRLRLDGRFLDPKFEAEVRAMAVAGEVELHSGGAFDPAVSHPVENLDLAVFPSLCEETYGLVVDEALARGVPVVVSDRGALAERVGAAGRVVAVDGPAPLAAVLRELAGDRGQLAAMNAAIPTEMRSIGDAAADYRSIYRGVLAAARSLRVMNHMFPPLLGKQDLRPPVLVLAAHPDDEVIGCGGILAWHRSVGHPVTVAHLTDGALGDPGAQYEDIAAQRRREGREALRRLGVDDVRSLGFPDGSVPEHLEAVVTTLRGLFREIAPQTLYSFFFTEAHRDHRALAQATALAADALPADCRCLLYGVNQVVVGATMFEINDFVEQKQRALSAFESQLVYNDWRQKIRGRDHAMTVNVEDPRIQSAEVFADLRPAELPRIDRLATALFEALLGGPGGGE